MFTNEKLRWVLELLGVLFIIVNQIGSRLVTLIQFIPLALIITVSIFTMVTLFHRSKIYKLIKSIEFIENDLNFKRQFMPQLGFNLVKPRNDISQEKLFNIQELIHEILYINENISKIKKYILKLRGFHIVTLEEDDFTGRPLISAINTRKGFLAFD